MSLDVSEDESIVDHFDTIGESQASNEENIKE